MYCVHVDTKANATVAAAIDNIASCFPNVFMVSQPVKVLYAGWTRVQADLNCMSDLLNVNTKWKYFINLCGQDFPMKTNLEMVRHLQALKGANDMESVHIPNHKKWRVERVMVITSKLNREGWILLLFLYIMGRPQRHITRLTLHMFLFSRGNPRGEPRDRYPSICL